MFKKTLSLQVPSYSGFIPATSEIDISAAEGTYMYKMFAKDGLHKFESEALGITAALIEYYDCAEFADVGSNIGVFSWCMKSIFGRSLDVHAYEPLPMLHKVMEEVCARNKLDVRVHKKALADTEGAATFYVSASTDSSNSLNKDFRKAKDEIQVELATLTSEAKRIGMKPKVIKVDTETTEPDVLVGGAEFIDDIRPFLIIEVLANRTEVPMTEFCAKHNYSAYRLDRTKLVSVDKIEGDKTYRYRDWLFAPSEVEFGNDINEAYIKWSNAFAGE